jgi:hypothetical protein
MSLQPAQDVPLLIKSPNSSSERRVSPSWTLAHLKARLEPITGVPAACQQLTLQLGSQPAVALSAANEEQTQLSAFPLQPYAEITVSGYFFASVGRRLGALSLTGLASHWGRIAVCHIVCAALCVGHPCQHVRLWCAFSASICHICFFHLIPQPACQGFDLVLQHTRAWRLPHNALSPLAPCHRMGALPVFAGRVYTGGCGAVAASVIRCSSRPSDAIENIFPLVPFFCASFSRRVSFWFTSREHRACHSAFVFPCIKMSHPSRADILPTIAEAYSRVLLHMGSL